jgi:hypothetical protein
MFYYKKEKQNYYIWSDEIKWKFWPFVWIICKNKYLWNTWKIQETKLWKEQNFLEKKYSFFDYSFWFSEDKIFVINKNWIEKILNY